MEVPVENLDGSVSTFESDSKYFLLQKELTRKLFDKELIKSIPGHQFKSLVQN